MRKFSVWFIALAVIASIVSLSAAATKDEAQALVKKASAYIKANGPVKATAAFNDPKGEFQKGELYIFALDPKGVTVAHINPKLIGKDMSGMKDTDGKLFQQEFLNVAAKGGGWVDYKWTNPTTLKVEPKTAYVERVGDLIVGCGVYK